MADLVLNEDEKTKHAQWLLSLSQDGRVPLANLELDGKKATVGFPLALPFNCCFELQLALLLYLTQWTSHEEWLRYLWHSCWAAAAQISTTFMYSAPVPSATPKHHLLSGLQWI